MKALITGGTGFLGSHLCDALALAGHEVTYTRRDAAYRSIIREFQGQWPGIWHEVAADVQDLPSIERVIADYEIDTVFHLAAQAGVAVAASDPTGTFRTNIVGTMNVLEACRRQKVGRVVIASTDKVYGSAHVPYVEDRTNLMERTPYGASKICAEVLAETYANAYGMSIAVTRCGNLYGPGHLNFSTLIPGSIRKILRGLRPVVRFGGLATRDFLYVRDAAAAYIQLALSDRPGAWNFSGGEPQRIIDVVRSIIGLLGSSIDPDIKEGAVGEIENQVLDCSIAKLFLGWKPKVTFREGLASTVGWYKAFLQPTPSRSLLKIVDLISGRKQ